MSCLAAVVALGILANARRRRKKAALVKAADTAPLKKPRENVEVRLAQDHGELLCLCRLRWLVYVGELKRQNYAYCDHVRQILEDPLDHVDGCFNFFIQQPPEDAPHINLGEELHAPETADVLPADAVGCVRVHVPSPAKYDELFSIGDATVWGGFASQPGAFAFFSRFMVHARYRGAQYGYANHLYVAAATAARQAGARFLLLNCTPALAPLYESRGFVRYKPACWDEAMGLQVPLALVLDDVAFLTKHDPRGPITEAVSALTRQATPPAGFPDPAACAWLSALIASRADVLVSSRLYSSAELAAFVSARGIDLDAIHLFHGINADERSELLARCPNVLSVIDVLPGTLISRAGDVRDESFLILRGSVDVDNGLETLGSGAVVGEAAFLSGEKRVCTIKIRYDADGCVTGAAAGAAAVAPEGATSAQGRPGGVPATGGVATEGSALLLVTSRVGFQKALRVVPHIAGKLLWNMATELSRKFTLRNEMLQKLSLDFEAKQLEAQRSAADAADAQRKAARAVEIAQFKEAAAKLRRLATRTTAGLSAVPSGGLLSSAMLTPVANAIPASNGWRASFDQGLETWKRLEQRYVAETIDKSGRVHGKDQLSSGGLKGRLGESSRLSATQPNLPSSRSVPL